MTGEPRFLPGARLWTPWRMPYVGGGERKPGCVFCNALAGEDDATSLIVHRGEHSFAIMNLFPYNTGHLMIVPYSHTHQLMALSQDARAEMTELTATFCDVLQLAMNCDGFNTGMNLGSAAGACIADHLHHHIVPRWTGDANFMPIIGGTKVLPELVAATYAKVRAEVARRKSGAGTIDVVMFAPDQPGLYVAGDDLPAISLTDDIPAWKSAVTAFSAEASVCGVLGWAGRASTVADETKWPALALSCSPRAGNGSPSYRWISFEQASALLTDSRYGQVREAANRLGMDTSEP